MNKKGSLCIVLCTIFLSKATDTRDDQPITIETSCVKDLTFDECKQAHHKELKNCFKILPHKERVQLFIDLSDEQRNELLKQLLSNLPEYEEFLDDFNEYDWKKVVDKIPNNERSYFPKTIYEQRMALFVLCNPNNKK